MNGMMKGLCFGLGKFIYLRAGPLQKVKDLDHSVLIAKREMVMLMYLALYFS